MSENSTHAILCNGSCEAGITDLRLKGLPLLSGGDGLAREKLFARSVADRDDRWMLEPSLHGDGIETIADFRSAPDDLKTFLFKLLFKHRGYWESSSARLSEGPQQGVVLKFSGNKRSNAVVVQPEIKIPAHFGILGGHQQRGVMKSLWKVPGQTLGQFWSGDERGAALTQQMVVRLDP